MIVQHMPGGFTAAFAERLDRDPAIPLEVAEARHGEPIRPGRALIIPAATSTAWSAGPAGAIASSWSRARWSTGSGRASTSSSARPPRRPAPTPSA